MGIGYENYAFDTSLGAYVLDPTMADYGISRIAFHYLEKEVSDGSEYKKGDSILTDPDAAKKQAS